MSGRSYWTSGCIVTVTTTEVWGPRDLVSAPDPFLKTDPTTNPQ